MERGKNQADYEVSEEAIAVMTNKNRQRLEMAKKLRLDFSTISISDETGLILFHGATDEQMNSEYQRYETHGDVICKAYGDVIGLKDYLMWSEFLDEIPEEEYRRRLETNDLTDIAKAIGYSSWCSRHFEPVARLDVKKSVETAHMRFVDIACPVDAVISVIDGSENTPECYDLNSFGNCHTSTVRLKESNGTGLVTIRILRQALRAINPYANEENVWQETWEDEIRYKVINPLKGSIGTGYIMEKLWGRLERIRDKYLATGPSSIIYRFLDTLPREERIQYWVTIIDATHKKFGYYPEVKKDYIYPRDIWPEVEGQLSYHKDPVTTQAAENEDSAKVDDETSDSDPSSGEEDEGESDSGRTSKKRKVGDA
ncbi:hypothetical protein V8F06_003099 [Rhypophila decipiens]